MAGSSFAVGRVPLVIAQFRDSILLAYSIDHPAVRQSHPHTLIKQPVSGRLFNSLSGPQACAELTTLMCDDDETFGEVHG